jgi:prepilin-type N-terminal cleavage/methylation domain-containing protein
MARRRFQRVSVNGFTLLELILVMIILCTVLAMAAPSLRGFFSSRQMMDLAEQIQTLTRYARIQAVSEARYFRLEFDLTEREYGLTVMKEGRYEILKKTFGLWYTLPTDLELEFENVDRAGGKYVLNFDLQGHSKPCRIRMRDSKNNRIDLVCRGPVENFELIVLHEDDV